ncbi:hypothetical protein ZHAS_00012394 [Anopheles sinensis]|uniref:Uncharacterized protein n=1 Tax=Anopheles sinensis TaxID=74873 RepID=A0A084W2P7_ANOSI|nr:hypothetical protein ZHAS_00012394 [Anopheles sinensis]
MPPISVRIPMHPISRVSGRFTLECTLSADQWPRGRTNLQQSASASTRSNVKVKPRRTPKSGSIPPLESGRNRKDILLQRERRRQPEPTRADRIKSRPEDDDCDGLTRRWPTGQHQRHGADRAAC